MLQSAQLLQAQQQAAAGADTTDTLAAAADTLSLADRLRADSTFIHLTNPTTSLGNFIDGLSSELLDTALWLGLLGVAMRALLILFLAWLAIQLIDRGTARWTRRFEDLPPVHPRRQRAYTVSNLLSSSGRYILWPVAIIMILGELDINIGALVATAGIAGLAIGFGAQTLVKDVISGIFLLFDDTIHVGDLVKIGSEAGTVEFIGVRLIKVRKFDGEVLMVPAGELRIFGNRSIGFARAVVHVGLSYEQDLDTVIPVMERVGREWAADHKDILLEEAPQVQGITDFMDSAIGVRLVVQVVPGEQFAAERELRFLLKRAFDQVGIEIPFPRRTVYMREDKQLPPRAVFDPAGSEDGAEPPGSGSD